MSAYLAPTQASAIGLLRRGLQGPVYMLNLLRFRQVADYAAAPGLMPPGGCSGVEAYDRYMAQTLPHLKESGGAIAFFGAADAFLIGPEAERWDRALLVRQASIEAFFRFAENEAYLAGTAHRTAALADARLLPLQALAHPE